VHVAFVAPTPVALHLVVGVKAVALDEAGSKAERHGGIVRPFPRIEVEGASADHIVDGGECSCWFEFQSCAYCVTGGQTQQTAAVTFEKFHEDFPFCISSMRAYQA